MKSFWKKCKRYLTDRSNRVPVIFAAIGAVVVTAAVILVVRAYLTAQSDPVQNPFAPMTYTDINIGEEVTSLPNSVWNNVNVNVSKKAYVTVAKASSLKPVYVRVAVTYAVYESAASDAINITPQYPNFSVGWDLPSTWSADVVDDDWTSYYYYNRIVLPEYTGGTYTGDGVTTSVFNAGDVQLIHADTLPAGADVRINVITDCVQAVSTDSSKWKESGGTFTTDEVYQAWGIRPTGSGGGALPSVTATGNALAISWPVHSSP